MFFLFRFLTKKTFYKSHFSNKTLKLHTHDHGSSRLFRLTKGSYLDTVLDFTLQVLSLPETTLETSGEDAKVHSKRV